MGSIRQRAAEVHEALAAATGMAIYFSQPYCSWQRGTDENTNGLVRPFLPKGTELTAHSLTLPPLAAEWLSLVCDDLLQLTESRHG